MIGDDDDVGDCDDGDKYDDDGGNYNSIDG